MRRRQKWNARSVTLDGYRFQSQVEADRYAELALMQTSGDVTDLSVHPRFVLQPAFRYKGKTVSAITYVADFAYTDSITGARIVEDVKGLDRRTGKPIDTPVSSLKRKWLLYQTGIDVRIEAR